MNLSESRTCGKYQYQVARLDRTVSFPDNECDISRQVITGLDMDPTERCTLRCAYCFKGQMPGRDMSLETAKQTVRWLLHHSGSNSSVHISLLGGEPLLSFDLLKKWVPFAMNYCKQRNKTLSIGVTTNLTVFTQEIHDFFKFWHIGIHSSLDGIPEVQNRYRVFPNGSGSSSMIERNLPLVFSAWRTTHARSTVTPETVQHLLASYQYFHRLGFLKVAFSIDSSPGWADADVLAQLRGQYREVLGYHWRRMWDEERYFVLRSLDDYVRAELSGGKEHRWGCGAGRGMLHVDADGYLWPCHRFNGKRARELLVLGSVWGGFNNRVRGSFLDADISRDLKADCQTCRASRFCSGPCMAANWQENADLYNPGAFCGAIRVIYDAHIEHIERIQKEEPERWEKFQDWVLNYKW